MNDYQRRMTDGTIVPRTPASEAKLHKIALIVSPAMDSIAKLEEFAQALVEFVEQAIFDDREQRERVN